MPKTARACQYVVKSLSDLEYLICLVRQMQQRDRILIERNSTYKPRKITFSRIRAAERFYQREDGAVEDLLKEAVRLGHLFTNGQVFYVLTDCQPRF
jgi:predicted choloylglycine hydrolase